MNEVLGPADSGSFGAAPKGLPHPKSTSWVDDSGFAKILSICRSYTNGSKVKETSQI